jgi:hypothetical protein
LQIFLLPKNLKRNAERPKGVFEKKKAQKTAFLQPKATLHFVLVF